MLALKHFLEGVAGVFLIIVATSVFLFGGAVISGILFIIACITIGLTILVIIGWTIKEALMLAFKGDNKE